jgi:FAD/FMN-containing dehydrogenase
VKQYESWGRFPVVHHADVIHPNWTTEQLDLRRRAEPVLPFGYGRSYGDTCLNEGGTLIDTTRLSRFIGFDKQLGLLSCEAGVSLGEILDIVVPSGWFLAVTPGTKQVTMGGAIANDVHGKNHHVAGTFGCHVRQFELLRSSGERLLCSRDENVELFNATIGGLGLTGVILWAEIQLKRIFNPLIKMDSIRFRNLNEFAELAASSDDNYEYTVAWVDCLAAGETLGRGIFMRGNHLQGESAPGASRRRRRWNVSLRLSAPNILLNQVTMNAFNLTYYYRHFATQRFRVLDYDTFFYPLDALGHWNRLYGSRGLLQYQCVVPCNDNNRVMKEILYRVSISKRASFLSVLKIFGSRRSPGMLSFPRPGVTLALDFPNDGEKTFRLLDELDKIVVAAGGAVYPAKDARMSAKSFQSFFSNWKEFSRYIDPRFSSSFWRRVTQAGYSQ